MLVANLDTNVALRLLIAPALEPRIDALHFSMAPPGYIASLFCGVSSVPSSPNASVQNDQPFESADARACLDS